MERLSRLMGKLTNGVLFVRLCKKIRGTVCPHVKIYGVLFVRVCKSTGNYFSACAKMTGTICPGYYLSGTLISHIPLVVAFRSKPTVGIA